MLSVKVSVIIPTHNREEKLNRLLATIVSQSPTLEFEIIVVDDSDKKIEIEPLVDASLNGRLKLIRMRNRVFVSAAKNIGWQNSKGEYVFFVDDDNVVPQRTIERLVSILDENKRIGAVMPVIYYEKKRDQVWVYATPFSRGRWSFNLIGRNLIEKSRPNAKLLPTDALPNASMIRRQILEEIGGFSDLMPVNSSCNLCQRIKNCGWEVYSSTDAPIYHDVSVPGTPGYWAEHASEDSARRYFEVRDWFQLMAELHSDQGMLVVKEFLHSIPFILAVSTGVLLHPTKKKQRIISIYLSMLRGLRDGIKLVPRMTLTTDRSK